MKSNITQCRFQRKQYSNIEIVSTEKKGYGLRAEEDLPRLVTSSLTPPSIVTFPSRDSFIYEYVGDVVNPVSFKKRMRDYAEEGIRHFYFMMLQKDEVRLSLTRLCPDNAHASLSSSTPQSPAA